MIRNKKGAMEMSMGTLVTIVLLMAVMVLGIVLVRSIFSSGTNAVNEIDNEVQQEIDKLFSDDSGSVVIYPPSREVRIEQGDSGGVGISLRNPERGEGTRTYSYVTTYLDDDCSLGGSEGGSYLVLGDHENGIQLGSGQQLSQARLIKLRIPTDAPLCEIRYKVVVSGGQNEETTFFDVEIVS